MYCFTSSDLGFRTVLDARSFPQGLIKSFHPFRPIIQVTCFRDFGGKRGLEIKGSDDRGANWAENLTTGNLLLGVHANIYIIAQCRRNVYVR